MPYARLCEAMAALRCDVDAVSWPSDSEMTVMRVSRQRRRLGVHAAMLAGDQQGQQGDGALNLESQHHSASLVNLATMEEAADGVLEPRLEPLTSWGPQQSMPPWDTWLELGDVQRPEAVARGPGVPKETAHSPTHSPNRSPSVWADKMAMPRVQQPRNEDAVMATTDTSVQTNPPPDLASVGVGPGEDMVIRTSASRWRSLWDVLVCSSCGSPDDDARSANSTPHILSESA